MHENTPKNLRGYDPDQPTNWDRLRDLVSAKPVGWYTRDLLFKAAVKAGMPEGSATSLISRCLDRGRLKIDENGYVSFGRVKPRKTRRRRAMTPREVFPRPTVSGRVKVAPPNSLEVIGNGAWIALNGAVYEKKDGLIAVNGKIYQEVR